MLSISKEVLKELGEPLILDEKQNWYFAYLKKELAGFIVHNEDTIIYAYTLPEYRGKGIFNKLYNEIPDKGWKTVSSNKALPIFIKLGFKIIKSYNICHKLKK